MDGSADNLAETGQCESGKPLYIVTGLSGAGKSTALKVFEDLGCFMVDGLPVTLSPEVALLMRRKPMEHFLGMAIGMDLRQDDFLSQFRQTLLNLAEINPDVRVIFLEADDEHIIRRYAATRRPHPLERLGLGLEAAIVRETELLRPVRNAASLIINTSGLSIHDLRRKIQNYLKNPAAFSALRVNLVSFGFKYGIPQDADFIFDLRFLANPYFVDNLKPLSGKDREVAEYVFASEDATHFKSRLEDLLSFTLDRMEAEGRYRVTVCFGCTGGRHRSVAMAEEFNKILTQKGYATSLEHRHLENDSKRA